MAITAEEIRLIIKSDSKDAQNALKKLNKSLNSTNKTSKKSEKSFNGLSFQTAAFAAALYATVKVMKMSINAGSKLEETTSKFNAVFGDSPEVLENANTAATELANSYAMSTEEARRYMASMQDLLVPMGLAPDLAGEMSANIVKLSADIGSFNNMPTSQVMQDISAAMSGSLETTRKYGVVLNETILKQEAMNEGLYDGKGALDAAARAQMVYKLMVKGSTAALNDMHFTSQSYANVVKRLDANIEDLVASMGTKMLPEAKNLAGAFVTLTSNTSAFSVILDGLGDVGNDVLGGLADAALNVGKVITKVTLSYMKMKANVSSVAEAQQQILHAGGQRREDLQKVINLSQNLKTLENQLYNQRYYRTAEGRQHLQEQREALEKERAARKKAALAAMTGQQKTNTAAGKGIETQKKAAEAAKKRSDDEQKAAQNTLDAEKRLAEQRSNYMKQMVSNVSSYIGQVSSLFSQHTSNRITSMQNETRAQIEALDAEYNARLEAEGLREETELEKSELRIEQLNADLMAAESVEDRSRIQKELKDAKNAKKRIAIQKEYDEKKKAIEAAAAARELKLKRDAARMQKKLSIAQVLLETPIAAMRAYSSAQVLGPVAGPIVGGINAGLATALGAAKLAIIQSTPLPEAASGAIVRGTPGGSALVAGENNRDEAIIPLQNEDALQAAGIGGSSVNVTINIENAFTNEEFPEEIAVRIDQALSKLVQDRNSRLQDSL